MLPASVREFLAVPRFCALAMTDERGRPFLARCAGWSLGPPGGPDLTVTVRREFVPILPGQGASDRVALLLSVADQFVAFQVKGRGRARDATPAEVQASKDMLASLGQTVEKSWGLSQSLYTSMIVAPAVSVDVMVEEAFAQSPGPGAGRRVEDAP